MARYRTKKRADNLVELLFTQRYDTEELLAQINAHAVNLRALEVRWIDRWARQTAIYCRIELPEWAHAEEVERKIADVMKAESWFVEEESHRWSPPRNFSFDSRTQVYELDLEGRFLTMKLGCQLAPYTVYQTLLGVDWEEAGRHDCERLAIEFDDGQNPIILPSV